MESVTLTLTITKAYDTLTRKIGPQRPICESWQYRPTKICRL